MLLTATGRWHMKRKSEEQRKGAERSLHTLHATWQRARSHTHTHTHMHNLNPDCVCESASEEARERERERGREREREGEDVCLTSGICFYLNLGCTFGSRQKASSVL